MLLGGGTTDATDAARTAAFQSITDVPKWIIGMEEPDCPADGMSSGMSIDASMYLSTIRAKGKEVHRRYRQD